MSKQIYLSCILLLLTLFVAAHGQTSPRSEETVEFKILTDRSEYARGALARVKFLLVNRARTPLYVSRGLGACSKWPGHSELKIVDQKNLDVTKTKCDAVVLGIADEALTQKLNDPRSWIQLGPGEIYGTEEDFELPQKRGSYRLIAELWPPGFPDSQKEILAQQQIRILQNRHLAPTVTIRVK